VIDNRVLSESAGVHQIEIAFHTSDLGAYLLSFELERETKNRKPHEFSESLKKC